MLPRDIPNGLWQEIAVGYLLHKGREYLLICNLFSKYPFPFKVSSKSAYSLSQKLQELISTLSLPNSTNLTPAPSDKEADSPCSAYLMHSMQSTRQLCPRLPITYTEAALMKLHGRLQIRMLNSISIPLPIKDSDQEESPMMSDSNCPVKESPMRSYSEDTLME